MDSDSIRKIERLKQMILSGNEIDMDLAIGILENNSENEMMDIDELIMFQEEIFTNIPSLKDRNNFYKINKIINDAQLKYFKKHK